MPRSSTGKWVSRAGATGGGRTYRGQVPVNWYVALVIIILAGLASIVFARYEYRQGTTNTANTVAPLKGGTPWYAAVDFDICGTQEPSLASDAANTTKQSFYTTGDGVITIAPKSTSDAGHNAVFGKFVSSYHGLVVTRTEIHLPTASTSSTAKKTSSKKTAKKTSSKTTSGVTYRDGDKCPAGTKDAGKAAQVEVTYWPNAFASKQRASTVQGSPATLPFSDDQLITVGFVPAGSKLPKPSGTVVTALVDAAAGSSTATTTTAPTATTTTAPTATTTTAPASKSG